MNKTIADNFTAVRLRRSVIEPIDFGRKRVFMKKKQGKPLTAALPVEPMTAPKTASIPTEQHKIMRTAKSIHRSASSSVRCLHRLLNRPTE